jgi:antitoxin PrlF
MEATIVENAKIMAKGQITLPRDVQARIGVGAGDRVALICEGDRVILMNAAVYAMRALQRGMEGKWEEAGILSDDDVTDIVKEVRAEIENR